jgi:hypothetical protein
MSSSRNINAIQKNAVAVATPYCKVCHDAGKPKSEYTNHFVKDQPGPNGKVICPTLLNQACRICHKTGHTSSYCPQYKSRRDDYREERYIPREEPRRDTHDRREEPRRNNGYYDSLREDTERRERDIRQRDEEYNRQQERRSKPWLQAALKKQELDEQQQQQQRRRHEPYAHPHGPRVRLNLEASALCSSKHATGVTKPEIPAIDIQKVNLNHASKWGDEDAEEPFVYNPEEMAREFFQHTAVMSNFTTTAEHEFIAACEEDQNDMLFFCGQ